MANEYAQKYYDALIASYDILADAASKAGERGLKVSQQLVEDITKGQREALELGKKLASEPTDMGLLYAGLMEATTALQSRALAFTQTAYSETVGAGSDTREVFQKLFEANKDTVKAAVDFARTSTSANPFVDAWRKGLEAMTPKGTEKTKAHA
jgi:hypothetical protein